MGIVIGIILMVLGFCMVYYANWMYYNLGVVGFFEKYLGGGGTRLGYKLIGIFVLFIGALSTFGLLDDFVVWTLGPVLKTMFPSMQ
jgi:hypothetical protein